MLAVKRLIESYLGIPPAGPGQGTAWRIEARHVGPEGWPEWLVVGLTMAFAIAIVALYFRETHRLPRTNRLLLLMLRLVALGLLAAMLSQATLAVDRTGLPVIALLIDDSASMSLTEGKSLRGAASPVSRLDLVRQELTRDENAFLETLAKRFRIRAYRFNSEAIPLQPHGHDDADVAAIVASMAELRASGSQTHLATSVRGVLDGLRGDSPSAIVIFTDGVSTGGDGETLSAIAPLAARHRVPLYPVGVGSDGPARDLELYELTADEVAFLGDPVRVVARFRAFGLSGKSVRLSLTDSDTGQVLAQATTVAGPDGRATQAELIFTPEVEGDLEVVLTLSVDGTEANQANNAATRQISVRKQSVRVLLADHAPRYEFRYLKSLLEREPTIELDTVLQEADLGFSADDRTALERFPLRKEEILAYDVILFGDLDPGLLGAEVLAGLEEFVRVKGGGLIGIAGAEFFPMRYTGTPLDPLIPVEPASVSVPAADALLADAFRPQLTLQARRSAPMFRMADSEEQSQVVWDSLPGLYWRADAAALRPGAVVLADSSDLTGRRRPVIVLHRYGAGKVLLHLTDETWRWRYRADDSYFGRYWIQTIRFLSRSTLLGRDRGAELTTDRRVYSQGEPITLRVRFLDERLIPAASEGVTVVVEDRGGGRRDLELSRTGELSDVFEGRLERLAEGNYHAWIGRPSFSGVPPAADFRVEAPDQELARRGADLADLRRAAQLSGGEYYDLADAERLPTRLPAGRPVRLEATSPRPLWNRPELLIALVGVLTAEWLVRKQNRLA